MIESETYSYPLFEEYFTYVKETEAPISFHRWSLLSCLGAFLGRQTWFQFGLERVWPNMFVMLMGDPGTRKSSAIKSAKKVLSAAGYENFSGDRTSKEKFLLDLEGLESDDGKIIDKTGYMDNLFGEGSQDPKEVFVVADEFNNFVGNGNIEFLSLFGQLWDWDDEERPYTFRLKNSRSVSIYQPTISILGGNTQTNFALAFPPASIGQGFLSRLLLIHGESTGRKIAFPTAPPEAVREKLITQLQKIKSQVHGEIGISRKAKEAVTTIYNTYQGINDARFQHYSTRRHTHLLKLCLLMAASDCRNEILMQDILFANSLLHFTEHKMPSALGEFGKAKNADVANKVMAVLGDSKKPLTQVEIWKHVSSDLNSTAELNALLLNLQVAGKIMWATGQGDQALGYIVKRTQLKNPPYVNYSLLIETRVK